MSERTAFRATEWVDVTPGAADVDIKNIPEGIVIQTAGDVVMKDINGTSLTLTLEVGAYPFRPKTIVNTGTTATVYALY